MGTLGYKSNTADTIINSYYITDQWSNFLYNNIINSFTCFSTNFQLQGIVLSNLNSPCDSLPLIPYRMVIKTLNFTQNYKSQSKKFGDNQNLLRWRNFSDTKLALEVRMSYFQSVSVKGGATTQSILTGINMTDSILNLFGIPSFVTTTIGSNVDIIVSPLKEVSKFQFLNFLMINLANFSTNTKRIHNLLYNWYYEPFVSISRFVFA